MEFKEVLSKVLEVKDPWFIREIDVHKGTKSVNVFIDYKEGSQFCCPECEQLCKVHDSNYRVWRHLNLFEYRCYLNIKVPRIKCARHKVRVIDKLPWGRMDVHFSYLFEEEIMNLSAEMSMSAVAKKLGETDTTLWRVFNYRVALAMENQMDFSSVRRICVDETASKRGHTYVTICSDLDTGNVLFVTNGRSKESFGELYEHLFTHMGDANNVVQFNMDMSKSYKAGRKEYFPGAEVVFDRFHIKKGLNEAIDKVRKQEAGYTESLKKTKYLWLKNEGNLTEKEKSLLHGFLIESSTNTAKAYSLKPGFDQLWQVQQKAVEPLLESWISKVKNTYLAPLKTFVQTIKNNYEGIVNSMKKGVSNAMAEGINSLIQLAKTRARGFRNLDNLKHVIYNLGNNFKYQFH